METNQFDPNLNPPSKKNQRETLEISPTGYGLAFVREDAGETHDHKKRDRRFTGDPKRE
ncbi:hypothetical protein ABR335_14725 [Heyndrickxia faecalis]|uniref:Uncharacterized protein n=1 Tax=Heyndrickxia faecalis TaxID=2824910 RepID=A0AAU7WG32_9BACI